MYYRIAGRLRSASTWHWRTTKLTSLSAVWAHLQRYHWPDHTELRVFLDSSVEQLGALLAHERRRAVRVDRGGGYHLWAAEASMDAGSSRGADEPEEPAQEDAHPEERRQLLPAVSRASFQDEIGQQGRILAECHRTPFPCMTSAGGQRSCSLAGMLRVSATGPNS